MTATQARAAKGSSGPEPWPHLIRCCAGRSRATNAGPTSICRDPISGLKLSSARSDLCHGYASDREQAADDQFWRHAIAKEQYARYQGEHRKQQAKGRNAAHGTTGNQPEPKPKPDDASDEDGVGERQPTTFIRRHEARKLSVFEEQ